MTHSAQGGIVAEGLSRSFGDVQAVRSMDLTVPRGAVTALVGPNGSGKTTLMLMLASLLAPHSGRVLVEGVDVAAEPRRARGHLGWMPDTLGVWETLTVTEILVSLARVYGIRPAAAKARADELLELVHLTALARRPARVLSRGQQQRLSLARALVHDPAVLLLDEPTNGLDPDSRIDLRNLLRGFAREGRAVLVSSHVLAELDEFSDRAVFVSDGVTLSTQSLGEADQQLRRYALRALDPQALEAALHAAGLDPQTDPDDRRSALTVSLSGDEAAAALLRRLVSDGVDVVSFAPAAGALEETYLRTIGRQAGGIR